VARYAGIAGFWQASTARERKVQTDGAVRYRAATG
jgi:hypothetical protein